MPSGAFCLWYYARRHWVANNVLGLAFSLQGVEHLSLGTVANGVILLSGERPWQLIFCCLVWPGLAWCGLMLSLQGVEHLSLGTAGNGVIPAVRCRSCWVVFCSLVWPGVGEMCTCSGSEQGLFVCTYSTCSGPSPQIPPPHRMNPPQIPPPLPGLFFYDIFWVFFTPVMVAVAKSFDAPIKLLFPRELVDGAMQVSGVGWGGVGRLALQRNCA